MSDQRRNFARIFRKFRKDAELHGLKGPCKRISRECARLQNNAEPIAYFQILKVMLRRMSLNERKENFSSLRNFLAFYANVFKGRTPENVVKVIILLLMEAANALGPDAVVRLMYLAKTVLKIEDVLLLDMIPQEHAGVVLRSFSALKIDPWGIRNFVGKDLKEWKLRSDALILFGYYYSFENIFYHSRFFQLQDENFKVDGKVLQHELRPEITMHGSVRMQLLLETLVALFTSKGAYERTILSLQWKAVTQPFISTTEMFTLLQPFFRGEVISLQEFCGHFKEHNTIFEVPEVTQPRSLKHLARVQIRNSLCEANNIGESSIDSLVIPHDLKSYLKLDWNPSDEFPLSE